LRLAGVTVLDNHGAIHLHVLDFDPLAVVTDERRVVRRRIKAMWDDLVVGRGDERGVFRVGRIDTVLMEFVDNRL